MEKLQVNKNDVLECYKRSGNEAKQALEALFGNEVFKFDYTQIKTYADACRHLGMPEHIQIGDVNHDNEAYEQANAMYKLLIICKAINNGQPYDKDGDTWFPVFVLYSKNEIEQMGEAERKRKGIQLLSAAVAFGAEAAGVRCATAADRGAVSTAHYGFPLCLNSEEAAMYVGKQFYNLCLQCYGIKVKED